MTQTSICRLANIETHLVDMSLYRWCMLTVGHVDNYYDTMHERSPDCQKFIEITHLAINESVKTIEQQFEKIS